MRPKCNNGIREQGLRREQRLGRKEAFYESLGQIIGLEVVKRAVKSSIGLRKISVKTVWRSRPRSKKKKRLLAA
jgi:hypothetical protein